MSSVLNKNDVTKLCDWAFKICFVTYSYEAGSYYSERDEFVESPVNGICNYVTSEIDPEAEFCFSISVFPKAYWSNEYLAKVKAVSDYKSTTGWFCFLLLPTALQ